MKKEAQKIVSETKKETGVDMEKLIDSNNLLWDEKYQQSFKSYEKQMKETE